MGLPVGVMNVNLLKKITGLFLTLALVLLASSLLLDNRADDVIKAIRADFPGQPTILFVFDSRNAQSIMFITAMFDYIDRNQLLINIGVVFLNSKVVPFNGRYQVIENKRIHGSDNSQDAFLYFSHEGKLLMQSTLSNIPDSLLNLINPQYAVDNQHLFESLLQAADSTDKISFLTNMKGHLTADFTCFSFFDQVCVCNSSVNTIRQIMEIENHSPKVRHFIIPMYFYSRDDIELIKNNNGFTVDFILPTSEDLKNWETIKTDPLHKHPFNELVVLADNQCRILLISNKWQDYLSWRAVHLKN